MIIPALCFVGGLVAMGRTKPQTAVRKLVCLGPRTGLVYSVEDLAEVGVLIVRSPSGRSVAQLQRAAVRSPGARGLIWQHGQGDPAELEAMRVDFALPAQKPAAVRSPAPAPLTDAERELVVDTLFYRAPETYGAEHVELLTRAARDERLSEGQRKGAAERVAGWQKHHSTPEKRAASLGRTGRSTP